MYVSGNAHQVSVSATINLPDQPADTGTISIIPLGGDGLNAPQAMYQLEKVGVTCDATSGTAQVFINMDPQYQAVAQNIIFDISSAGGDKELICAITDRSERFSDFAQVIALLPTITGVSNARASWCPVPLFDLGQINGVIANVDTEALLVSAQILLFNRRATELVPLNILVASLSRSASMIT